MAQNSSIWLRVSGTGSEVHFSGITQIRHSLSLKVATDTDTTEIVEYLNGAREQPAKVTLSLVETDAGHRAGWAARKVEILDLIRSSKVLVEIYTPIRNYYNMVLSDLVIIQEDGNPNGWTGTATFTEVLSEESGGKEADNSSAVVDTGVAAAGSVGTQVDSEDRVRDSPLRQMLQRAGIGI